MFTSHNAFIHRSCSSLFDESMMFTGKSSKILKVVYMSYQLNQYNNHTVIFFAHTTYYRMLLRLTSRTFPTSWTVLAVTSANFGASYR